LPVVLRLRLLGFDNAGLFQFILCRAGEKVATLKLSLDGQPYGEFPVVALEDVPLAGILGRGWDAIRLFFK